MAQELDRNRFNYHQQILGRGDLTLDAWGNQVTVTQRSLFHGVFTYSIPNSMWLLEENNVELIDTNLSANGNDSVNGELVVSSGATSSKLYSRRNPRYQPNRGHRYSSSIFLDNPDALGSRKFGLGTDEDGVYFELLDGTLYAVIKSLGVDNHIKDLTNSLPDGFDLSKGNTYDIQMQWRGVGNIKFFVGSPVDGFSRLVHEFSFAGKESAITVSNPAMPILFEATNGGDACQLRCGCVDVTTEGGYAAIEQFVSATSNEIGVDSTLGTTASDNAILVIKIPTTIGTRVNTRDTRLNRIKMQTDKKGSAYVYMTRDASAITNNAALSWNSINDGGIETLVPTTSTDLSIDLTKCRFIDESPVEAGVVNNMDNPNLKNTEFFLTAGDYVIILGTGATATMKAVVQMGEEI